MALAADPSSSPTAPAPRASAAEFPNDNAALHAGARWLCWTVCAPPRALVQSHAFAPAPRRGALPPAIPEAEPSAEIEVPIDVEDFAVEAAVVAELQIPEAPGAEPLHALVAEAVSAALDDVLADSGDAAVAEPDVAEDVADAVVTEQSDAYLTFVRAVSRVAQGAGATRAAIAAEQLLTVGRADAAGLDEAVIEALVANGSVERGQSALTATASFADTARGWRAVLTGESDDLSACGDGALDQWAAALLGALLAAATDRQNGLRRELRRQGVAAFGLLDVAA